MVDGIVKGIDVAPNWVPLAPHEVAWLRDQAALAAVKGMAGSLELSEQWIAKRAYAIADALLDQREYHPDQD